MKKTVCELFAGVGGFRCGLNGIKSLDDIEDIKNGKKNEKWDTVWFSQWEPAEKNTQYAHDCYVYHFGTRTDKNGEDTTNCNIEEVDKKALPDFNLLVGGFPCQDYSVASSLATSKGLEGKKGVLWWSIRETIEEKKPPFVLLENVDRLIKSPAKQRGRDFGIILACFQEEGYTVEWRVINAAEYGWQQRRRRIFIFAYKNDTKYNNEIEKNVEYNKKTGLEKKRMSMGKILQNCGFFAETFTVHEIDADKMLIQELPKSLGKISTSFKCPFENTGIMKDGVIYTIKTEPDYSGKQRTLGDIMETGDVDEQYFIPEERLYYTDDTETHSDETRKRLSKEKRQTWQYLKGAKKMKRKSASGHEYIFSEGAIPMIDSYDKPARTMLTSEGNFSRTTHIVRDKKTNNIRLLTAQETERIQGFPTDHTKNCLVDGEIVEMPIKKRRFMMGNALVVDLIREMEVTLSEIFENEDEERNGSYS
ncbi:MAG: DNA (cytosine-5-)-methyltransferase [Lachnospiraceae bacterium]|nr:DNA (cytosine-5-)-methyltransferase [Lachnospiraceae bacterium]